MIAKWKEEPVQKLKPDPSQFDLEVYQQMFEHPKFTEWANGDNGILVLAAHPGTDMSVLAKHLLDELPK